MLIESYYTRIRTTQAVTRTFVISRFSDYTLLLAAAECNSFCDNFQLPVIFANILNGSSENIVLLSFISDINIYSAFAATLFCAAAAKCAQFVLFV